jgi:GNAT superfamily N-acetyltransferase
MALTLFTPDVDSLSEIVSALREWQYEGAPIQLHPGDIGWFWRFGAARTAAAVRAWRENDRIVAAGLLDGATLLRLTTDPELRGDDALARRIADDLAPERGVLPAGEAFVEAPTDAAVHPMLASRGWAADEPWTPLQRDLASEVDDPGVRIETVGPDVPAARRAQRVAVHRASFDNSTFTADDWSGMAEGPAYADARCLVAYDGEDTPVAAVTVWSAGVGKPGLLEPLGVHGEHRGHGYGRAIALAAAAALRELGSSSAVVCTPSSNTGAVATYRSAGFEPAPERRDRRRPS